jgi:hypothetical protein
MDHLIGDYISQGAQGAVYHASEYFNKELTGVYGSQFVVKIIDYYTFIGPSVLDDNPLIDMRHILRTYEKVKPSVLPHVLPLVRWIVFFEDGSSMDSVSHSISDIGNRTPAKLLLVFPLLEGTIASQIDHMNVNQRKDVCLQMINIVRSLHAVGLTHGDLHMNNLMYRKLDSGYYHVFAIDLDKAGLPGTKEQDYYDVCDYVARIMYRKAFERCDEIKTKKQLYALLITLAMHTSSPRSRKEEALESLSDVFKNTTFE